MKKINTEQKVEDMIANVFKQHQAELVDVEFVKEGQNWYLRIYIDKEGGIAIEDCEIISKAVEAILDERDIIEQAYILEVSSPGLDKPLKKDSDFVKHAGDVVDIKLYKAIDKQKEFQGKLKGLEANVITIIDDDGKDLSFDKKDIASIRLAVLF